MSHHPHYIIPVVAFLALASAAPSQVTYQPPRPDIEPGEALRLRTLNRASETAGEARKLLRQGKTEQAEGLALQAVQLCESIHAFCSAADDVLAEAAMLARDPKGAILALHKDRLSYRGRMTWTLALLALQRSQEAHEFLLRAAGTVKEPTEWRSFAGGWMLPMDERVSPDSLAATAYLLRVTHQAANADVEVADDLRRAEKLAPDSGAIQLMLAEQFMKSNALEDAKKHYAKAALAGHGRTRRLGELGLKEVQQAIDFQKFQKPRE